MHMEQKYENIQAFCSRGKNKFARCYILMSTNLACTGDKKTVPYTRIFLPKPLHTCLAMVKIISCNSLNSCSFFFQGNEHVCKLLKSNFNSMHFLYKLSHNFLAFKFVVMSLIIKTYYIPSLLSPVQAKLLVC